MQVSRNESRYKKTNTTSLKQRQIVWSERTLDFRLLRCLAQQSNFTNVVAFTNNPGDFPIPIDGNKTSNIVSGKFLHRVVDRKVFADGVINTGVATLVPGVGGGKAFFDGDHAPGGSVVKDLVTTNRLGGDGTGNAGG